LEPLIALVFMFMYGAFGMVLFSVLFTLRLDRTMCVIGTMQNTLLFML